MERVVCMDLAGPCQDYPCSVCVVMGQIEKSMGLEAIPLSGELPPPGGCEPVTIHKWTRPGRGGNRVNFSERRFDYHITTWRARRGQKAARCHRIEAARYFYTAWFNPFSKNPFSFNIRWFYYTRHELPVNYVPW